MSQDQPSKLPKSFQDLLLAAFNEDEGALNSYCLWRDCIDFENISYGEYELLSKVYKKLKSAGFQDSLTPKIKGITRRNWLESELYKKTLAEFFEILDEDKIEFVLLNRQPLASTLQSPIEIDFSWRNFQVLIRKPISPNLLAKFSNAEITQQKDQQILLNYPTNLRIGILLKNRIFGDDIWKTNEKTEFNDKSLRILTPPDYLLHLLETEFLPQENRKNGLWIIYAILTLKEKGEIDWERIAWKSQALQLNFSLVEMLDEAAKFVPSESYIKNRYLFFVKPPNKLQRTFLAFRSLKKSYRKTGENFSIGGFISFLRRHWNVGSSYELLEQIGRRFLKY